MKRNKPLWFWANTGLMCWCLLPPAQLFWLMQYLFPFIHQQGQETTSVITVYISHILWLYVGIKTILCQGLQINCAKAAFAHVSRAHDALHQHSSCSAFHWWFPVPYGQSLRPQHIPCALIVWPHIQASHIQKLLLNLLKLCMPGAEMSLTPHTSSEITVVDEREALDAKAFWTDKEINQAAAPSTLKLQMEQRYKIEP